MHDDDDDDDDASVSSSVSSPLTSRSLCNSVDSVNHRERSISSSRPATAARAADHFLNPKHKKGEAGDVCGLRLTGNAKTLIISIFLFGSITIGQ